MVKPPQPTLHAAFLWEKLLLDTAGEGRSPCFSADVMWGHPWWPRRCRRAPVTPCLSRGQRQSGEVVPAASVKHISHRRFLATFQLDAVSRAEQDLYRCVTQSARGAGVSNFAELIVKGG